MTKIKIRRVPFGDARFDADARARIMNIVESGRNTEHKYVKEFEDKFASRFGYKHAVMTSSGTTAGEVLWMAVAETRGLASRRPGVVLTPALAFAATANCIIRAGLKPGFQDIEPHLNMAVPAVNYRSSDTIGIQFVLNMGRTIGIAAMREYARNNDLFFAVDACEGHGAMWAGKDISKWADAATYSFYPAHIMTCAGEGGMIATNSKRLADLCRSIKSHGRPSGQITHDFQRVGTNSKSTEFAAAVGLSALDEFNRSFVRRTANTERLLDELGDLPVELFPPAKCELIGPHAFPVIVQEGAGFTRDKIVDYLEKNGVETRTLFSSMPTQCADG